MQERTRREVLELCHAAERMQEAANNLWWAHNPDADEDGTPPTLDEAQEEHACAFANLHRAVYYARKALDKEAALRANTALSGPADKV